MPSEEDTLYDPFRRHDAYGCMGQGPLPLRESMRLALAAVFVLPVKIVGSLGCLVACYLSCRASFLVPRRRRPAFVAAACKGCMRCCLFCLGFWRVEWRRLPPKAQHAEHAAHAGARPGGIVSNHCSWIDILVNTTRYFPSFVARDSTADQLLVGLISKHMGCIYVNRDNKTAGQQGISGAVKARMLAVAAGHTDLRPMLLFPEGTTTNGSYLLPFKTGGFLAGVPVQPIILRYGHGRLSPSWESISAPRHIFLTLCNFHSVTAFELPLYQPSPAEQSDPVLYAKNVREYMLSYQEAAPLKPASATYEDKRAYHQLLRDETVPVTKKTD